MARLKYMVLSYLGIKVGELAVNGVAVRITSMTATTIEAYELVA